MAIEAKRGCGFRKVGGLYLIAPEPGRVCGRLPMPLVVCPACGAGIKPSRGWTWIDPAQLFAGAGCYFGPSCHSCPAGLLADDPGPAGLLWVGEQYYPTPAHFQAEAAAQGISRRIAAVPRGFEVGKTRVYLAHRIGMPLNGEIVPAVFMVIRPLRVELVVTDQEAEDLEAMHRLQARGITPFVVPHDDPDHNPGGILH